MLVGQGERQWLGAGAGNTSTRFGSWVYNRQRRRGSAAMMSSINYEHTAVSDRDAA